jgi:DNA-3-methyladenine glycosylase II
VAEGRLRSPAHRYPSRISARRFAACPRITPAFRWLYDRNAVTPEDYARARRVLLRRDPVLAALIKRHGPCGLAAAQRADHFSALVRAITFQQLSTKAASTIYGRMVAMMAGAQPTVDGLAALTDEQLRTAGVSRQKMAYLRDLCAKIASGALPLDSLDGMPDEEVIIALTQVKGIGRWSAEMFLMFRLHRPDVLPVGDLGIVNAVHKAYGLRKRPTADRIRRIGEAWKPYRSIASWYLWRSLDNNPSR